MRDMTTPLSAQRIAALAGATAQRVAIDVVAETGSTNADLLARLDRLAQPALLLAESQSAGRGRAGRPWHAAPGAALMFSLAWKFRRPLHALAGLPLAVGVAVAQTLAGFGVAARLKWPNDVLCDGRKLAGILIESATPRQKSVNESWAVIGVGINIAPPEQVLRQIGNPVAGMPEQTDRNALMAALLEALARELDRFEQEGFAAFMESWNHLHAYAGQAVVILDQGRLLHEGMARGVDSSGRLQLETAAGMVALMAGDVSLRPKGA